jgi:hypothetical protein
MRLTKQTGNEAQAPSVAFAIILSQLYIIVFIIVLPAVTRE